MSLKIFSFSFRKKVWMDFKKEEVDYNFAG